MEEKPAKVTRGEASVFRNSLAGSFLISLWQDEDWNWFPVTVPN